jgi:hypothetical protein
MTTHLEETLESADRDMTPTNLSSASHGGKIEVASSNEEIRFTLPDLVPLLVAALAFLRAGFVKDLTGLGLPTASA